MRNFWLFFLFSVVFVSCDEDYGLIKKTSLYLTNESNDTICVYVASGYYKWGPTAYPDTTLPRGNYLYVRNHPISEYIQRGYPPHQGKHVSLLLDNYIRSKVWYSTLEPCILPRDTLSVFFICKDTFNLYGYDDVRENSRIQLRIDFSKYDLKEIESEIHYPPRPEMRYMHMSPSYDEFYRWYDNH